MLQSMRLQRVGHDCSLPGFSVHGILQVTILEWVAMSFSRVQRLFGHKCWEERQQALRAGILCEGTRERLPGLTGNDTGWSGEMVQQQRAD